MSTAQVRKEVVVRLYLLAGLLAVDVWITWRFNPRHPVLLIPIGIVTAGLAACGLWSVWRIFSKK